MRIIYAVVVSIMVAGCDSPPDSAVKNDVVMGLVRDFNVNGTRCISWQNGYAGGLQCDFKESPADGR